MTGCARHFVPTTPRAATDVDGLRVRVVGLDSYSLPRVRVRFGTRVHIEVEAVPQDTRLTAALFVEGSGAPCAGDDAAMARTALLEADGADAFGRPLTLHSRVVFEFVVPWNDPVRLPMRLDLTAIVDGVLRCIPLDVTSPAPDTAWTSPNRGVLSWGFGGTGYSHPVNGSIETIHLPAFLIGGWAGPLRLSIGTGVTIDACSVATCGDGKGRDLTLLALPLYLHADVFPVQTQYVSLGIGARYSLYATWKDPVDDTKLTAYQTFALTPLIAFSAPKHTTNGIDLGLRTASIEIELPIGVATPLGRFDHPAGAIGAGLYFNYGF